MNIQNKECPLIPMGAITGKPSKQFLTETLEAYRDVGITQFLIYPRTGCELEYLSDEWFDVCEHVLKEAERLNFTSIWLYDEFNWPSGTCARRVMKSNPDFTMDQLCVYQENGKYHFIVRKNPNMSALMNPDAVAEFIRMTHEEYAKRFEKYMGTLIKGIFTDEPDIAYFCWEPKEDILRMPYYPGLEADYKAASGSDLHTDIEIGLKTNSIFYREICNKLFAEKFRKNFVEQIAEWGRKHNVVLTGHLMGEYSTTDALSCSGHPLSVLSAFTLPGMDEIFTHRDIGRIEWLTLGTVMYAAEKRGNLGALAELFALGPSDLTPTQIRRQLWLAASFGVSKYVLAVSALDHRGNLVKRAYFCPFTRTQPWFEAFRELGTDAVLAAESALKERECRIAVRYPHTPQPLSELLKRLTSKQYAWRLVLPEEEADADVVLSYCNGKILEEKSGTQHFDFGNLEHDLLEKLDLRSATVENPDGSLAEDTFVRCFMNGEITVIDFSGKERNLILNRRGVRSNFELPAEGVIRFAGWQVTLDMPNTMRADFENGICKFTVRGSISDLRLCIRTQPPEVKLLLDGVPVHAENPCSTLPQGFRELYQQTDILTLSEGVHELKWENLDRETPYLPEAILTGNFAATREKILTPYRNDGVGLYGYVGKIIQAGTLEIPCNALRVTFQTQNFASELFLAGQSLGKRLHAPFTWILPNGTQGKEVEFKLIRMTSCGPLFGEGVFHREAKHNGQWLLQYAPDNSKIPTAVCEAIWE